MGKTALAIRDLAVVADRKSILSGVTLVVRPGELHLVMGPNGSGKTTFAHAIAGNPMFSVSGGTVRLGRLNLLSPPTDQRARLGIFVAFQQPLSVPGVSISDFLRVAASERNGERLRPSQVHERMLGTLPRVGLASSVLDRELNVGFSGGEQKRLELAQLLFLGARFAVLDEIDSGLDVDGMRQIAVVLESVRRQGTGVLLITHNPHILDSVAADAVHVLARGKIVASGGKPLADKIAQGGFRSLFAA